MATPLDASVPRPQPVRLPSGSILIDFLYWYVLVAPKNIFTITSNYAVANVNFFAIGYQFRTLFAFWHRDAEAYNKSFDIGKLFESFVINIFSRLIGFLIRFTVIMIGLWAEAFIIVAGVLFFVWWFTAPFVIIWLLSATPHIPWSSFRLPSLPSLPSFTPHHGVL